MRFVGFLMWLVALAAQPAFAQSSIPTNPAAIAALEQRLAATASENPGEFGFAVMDLDTGAIHGFNRDVAFPMASTMKIAVAAAYLAEVDAGRRSLNDQVGGTTAVQLMDAMITRSDNRATDQLMATLGGPAVIDGWLRRHGLTGMRVDRTIAQLLSDRRDLWDARDSSTPVAMLQLLRLLDRGDALRPASREILLDMMNRCRTGSNRIRGLLPAGTRVEHKTGTLSGYTGDVAFVTLPDGRRLAMAMFARGGENRPAVIATASRTIYDAFTGAAVPVRSGNGGVISAAQPH